VRTQESWQEVLALFIIIAIKLVEFVVIVIFAAAKEHLHLELLALFSVYQRSVRGGS
jgi:hypothetical protein